jgi:hypothetical protein
MPIPNGPYFDRRSRDWVVYVDNELWRDADDEVRHFLTAEQARDAVEREVYGPRRAT